MKNENESVCSQGSVLLSSSALEGLCIGSAGAYFWEHTRQDPNSAKVSKSTNGHLQVVHGLWKVEESNSHHLKGKGGL